MDYSSFPFDFSTNFSDWRPFNRSTGDFHRFISILLYFSPILEIANYRFAEYHDGSYVSLRTSCFTTFLLTISFYFIFCFLSCAFKVPVCLATVDTFWPSFFFIGSISVFFLLPLFILIVLYSVIAKHLMINPSLISAQGNRSNFIKYRKQVILMLATVVISFFTCLLPFRAFTLWIILVPADTIMDMLSSQKGGVKIFSSFFSSFFRGDSLKVILLL